MSNPALKPCPFCGEPPEYKPHIPAPYHHSHWPEHVQCKGCRVIFRSGEHGVTNAVDKWNTRNAGWSDRLEEIAMALSGDQSDTNTYNQGTIEHAIYELRKNQK